MRSGCRLIEWGSFWRGQIDMSESLFILIGVLLVVAQVANIAWFLFMKKRNDAVYAFRTKAIDFFYEKRDMFGYYVMPSYDEMFWQFRKWDWSEYLK